MNKYIGSNRQIYSVTEATLNTGKGRGMRMLFVKNGKGLDFIVSLDRAGDISELSVNGTNFAYVAPCEYVAPWYYDNKGTGFLKSFTAGFLTTCGLTSVGSPCVDNGEELGLHGTVSHIPCESYSYFEDNGELHIKVIVRDASLFSHKLLLEREYVCSLMENTLKIKDTVTNIGFDETPIQMLYHFNMGYPLLSEKAELDIPSAKIIPRNEHSATGINECKMVEVPQKDYTEMCFYHEFDNETPTVSLYNKEIKKGVEMTFNKKELPFFTQWKMMGMGEYVMGLEPGNCNPDGRDKMRQAGMMETLKSGEAKTHNIFFKFITE